MVPVVQHPAVGDKGGHHRQHELQPVLGQAGVGGRYPGIDIHLVNSDMLCIPPRSTHHEKGSCKAGYLRMARGEGLQSLVHRVLVFSKSSTNSHIQLNIPVNNCCAKRTRLNLGHFLSLAFMCIAPRCVTVSLVCEYLPPVL